MAVNIPTAFVIGRNCIRNFIISVTANLYLIIFVLFIFQGFGKVIRITEKVTLVLEDKNQL